MRPNNPLSASALLLLTIAFQTLAAPTPFQAKTSAVERATVDGDDAVVYSWSVEPYQKRTPTPTTSSADQDDSRDEKKREVAEDGDDAVVYSWAIDSQDETKKEKKRGEEVVEDGDDAVVYSWAIDAEEK